MTRGSKKVGVRDQLSVDFYCQAGDVAAIEAGKYLKKQIKSLVKNSLDAAYAFEKQSNGLWPVGDEEKEDIFRKYKTMRKLFNIRIVGSFNSDSDLIFVLSTVNESNIDKKRELAKEYVKKSSNGKKNRVWVSTSDSDPSLSWGNWAMKVIGYEKASIIDESFASGIFLENDNGFKVHFSLYTKDGLKGGADYLTKFCEKCIEMNRLNLMGMVRIMHAVYLKKTKDERTLMNDERIAWYKDRRVSYAVMSVIMMGLVTGCTIKSGGFLECASSSLRLLTENIKSLWGVSSIPTTVAAYKMLYASSILKTILDSEIVKRIIVGMGADAVLNVRKLVDNGTPGSIKEKVAEVIKEAGTGGLDGFLRCVNREVSGGIAVYFVSERWYDELGDYNKKLLEEISYEHIDKNIKKIRGKEIVANQLLDGIELGIRNKMVTSAVKALGEIYGLNNAGISVFTQTIQFIVNNYDNWKNNKHEDIKENFLMLLLGKRLNRLVGIA